MPQSTKEPKFVQSLIGRAPTFVSFKQFIRVRPIGLRNALRFYSACGPALLWKVIAPNKFKSIGHVIAGRSNLTVYMEGFFAQVRPGTNDLASLSGAIEPASSAWFDARRDDTVIDVGAHIGKYTLLAALRGSTVVAIEPDPRNFSMLSNNIRLNNFSTVVPLHLALGETVEMKKLYLAPFGDTATSSLDGNWSERIGMGGASGFVEVEVETLDHVVRSMKIETIDWLKVDVEGQERSVLSGARSALRMTRNLLLEVAEGNEADCKRLAEEAGLHLDYIETFATQPTRISNWLFTRNG
ncbi:MAG TPA: FkbM family methyltransferase [Candidatus Angelobacter sp.]|nr:FkbM family methyltransferase [Candidatus Angelobacter sp.]